MKWDHKHWGVEFRSSMKDERPLLLSNLWRKDKAIPYPDEPTRPMLFTTRRAARKWRKEKMDSYSTRKDCCAEWKFKVIRVREIHSVINAQHRHQTRKLG